MADFDEREFDAATERGRQHFVEHPHARSAQYDASTGMVTLDLYNGCRFAFPPRQLQGLENATDAQLAEIELSGWGFGLHWEKLDADFTVPGLLAGTFGTKRYMEHHRERLRAILTEIERSDLRPAAE
jgi:Protein of unknown function (DUF2442)